MLRCEEIAQDVQACHEQVAAGTLFYSEVYLALSWTERVPKKKEAPDLKLRPSNLPKTCSHLKNKMLSGEKKDKD